MSHLLRSWISLNGWIYEDVTSIVEALSGGVSLIHGSQISNLVSGKLEPKPRLFVGLHYLNEACAFEQTKREQLPTPIAQKLIGTRVVCSPCKTDPTPWTAGDFLDLFCGLKPHPHNWLKSHGLPENRIYEYLQNLTRLTHELVKAKNDEIMPSFLTITSRFPVKTEEKAKSALAGASILSADQFDEFLPYYATGIGRWLGAIVTPYKLLEYIDRPWDTQISSQERLHHFVNHETTLNESIKPRTIELEFDLHDDVEPGFPEVDPGLVADTHVNPNT
ncbi:hypothetical protein [Vulcanococcus limneticus]|uniref:hypothetical protein n=1 Tax=Vulcanococcus limneticus TaxID=2170428 RepID=UPI00398BD6AB